MHRLSGGCWSETNGIIGRTSVWRPFINPPFAGEIRLISLAEASEIVGLEPEDMIQLAVATADWGDYRLSMFFGPGGPFFDADECEGLALLYAMEEADASGLSKPSQSKLMLKTH